MQLGHGENNLWPGEYFKDNDVTIACILCYDFFSNEIALSHYSCSFFLAVKGSKNSIPELAYFNEGRGICYYYFFTNISDDPVGSKQAF